MVLYDLALTLSMPVYKLMSEMPYDELQKWMLFLERCPLGWRDDLRMYIVLRQFGIKAKPEQVFSSLEAVMKRRAPIPFNQTNVFQMLLGAQGGDKVEALFNEIPA